jgi:hypothetical protein
VVGQEVHVSDHVETVLGARQGHADAVGNLL